LLLYTLKRILYVTPVVLGVSVVCFLLVHLSPGDPLTAVMPIDATAEQQAEMRAAYGFDRPLPVQYGIWLFKVLQGDLGNSIATGRPVLSEVGRAVGNSLILAAVATLIALLSAYVLSRFHFRGKGAVMLAFLVTQMIPAFIALGPLYQMFTNLGLVDSRFGLVLIYIAMTIPFSAIMLRGFFDNVPDSLEEAAMVDGCTRFSALWRVIVPVMGPGIIATFIFNFVNVWNELFLAVTLINTTERRTIPTALNSFISSFNIEWGPMAAAAVLTILPTMVLFAFASRWIVEGLTAGATKG